MMFQRLPALSVMVLVIARVIVNDIGGTCLVKSTPNAFWLAGLPPSLLWSHL